MFPQYDLTMGAPGNLLVDFTSLVVYAFEATVEIRITPHVDSVRRQNGINVCVRPSLVTTTMIGLDFQWPIHSRPNCSYCFLFCSTGRSEPRR